MKPKYPLYVPGLGFLHQGKIRESYKTLDPDLMLVVASDRISTHEVVHQSPVPRKGEILTATTIAWLTGPLQAFPNHLVAYGKEIFDLLPAAMPYPEDLHLRGMIVRKCNVPDVEFINRSRMAGSLWKKFYSQGRPNPYGLDLPEGLQLMSPFDELVFTPTEKDDARNDPPLNSIATEAKYPDHVQLAHEAYDTAWRYAKERGIEIIDTKLEIGRAGPDSKVELVDELFTGDSSRFVYTNNIVVGQEPPWADKQIVREEAERVWAGGPKVPLTFDPEILTRTTAAYLGVFETLFGVSLEEFQEIELS